jgi:acyl-coenzyme A synthetase/AMP-(fatty) acid ligase
VSFRELQSEAERFSRVMRARGLSRGDRCLVWARNSVELAACLLAVWRVGAIVALVDDEAPQAHVEHAARVTQPRLAVVQESHRSAAGGLDCDQIILDGTDCDAPDFPVPPGVFSAEPASIFFTSGSTGAPKGVTQSHANLLAGCRMVADNLGLRADDTILCPIPWAFDYGYGQLLSTVLLGVTQILPAGKTSINLCDAIERHRPTIFAGLPSIFALLFRGISSIRKTDLSSIRLITNTGGPISAAIFADVVSHFTNSQISLNYGMTETYRSAGLPVDLATEIPGSVGYAYPGVSLCILREDGTEAAPGEVGQIIHRGTGVFMGYWGDPEATARILQPDPFWTHSTLSPPMVVFTGDMGWKDEAGRLYIQGRRDRQIKSMGVRVGLDEVENLIRKSGLVREVAVTSSSHEILGEMVIATATFDGDEAAGLNQLKGFCRQELSQYMQPREYYVLPVLPLTPNKKTNYGELKTLIESLRCQNTAQKTASRSSAN